MSIKPKFFSWVRAQQKLLIGLTIGSVVGGSAIALAAIPDSSGVIHGCYKSNGTLSVIDTGAGQTCGGGQTALTWNQTGPQGPAGSDNVGGFLSNLVGANFNGASLQYRDFSGADLHGGTFSSRNITGASFRGANLSSVTITPTSNRTVDFSNANLTGVTWSNTTCPDGTNSDNNSNTCVGHLAP